jgi:ParB-like chromosome segregation protein Spo0J
LLKAISVKIEDVYVPAGRRKELDADKLDQAIEGIMEDVELEPIQVRKGDGRYVLVKGIHRLEARKALGDINIQVFIVGARLH